MTTHDSVRPVLDDEDDRPRLGRSETGAFSSSAAGPGDDPGADDDVGPEALDDADAVLRRLAVARALARGTAAEPGRPGAHAPVDGSETGAVTHRGVRWRLRPVSAVAVMALVVLLAGAGWWLSRPAVDAAPYAGAEGAEGAAVGGATAATGAEDPVAPTAGDPVVAGAGGAQGAPLVPGDGIAGGMAPGGGGDGAPGTAGSGTSTTIEVHVVGAVREPGLVTVSAGARVGDVVLAAGGLTRRADQRSVNLARVVADGEQVVVPRRGERTVGASPSGMGVGAGASGNGGAGSGSRASTAAGAPEGVVNLNSADVAALDTLPGIGPALAQRIVDWREQNGAFTAVEQLLDVSGIGEATFARLHDRIAL